jgi:integrase
MWAELIPTVRNPMELVTVKGILSRSYTCFYEKLGRVCQDAGIKHVSAHSFRHIHRAWLHELGTPISVQQRAMRHGDIRLTMNVYADPVSDALREALSSLEVGWETGIEPATSGATVRCSTD